MISWEKSLSASQNKIMMTRKSLKYVPFVLCTMGFVCLFPAGCKKEEVKPPAPPPARQGMSTVAERMADPEYVKTLDAQGAERKELVAERAKLTVEVQKMLRDMRAKMPGADAAAVKAALEKDAAYSNVVSRIKDLTTNLEVNRIKTQSIVRERMMTGNGTISK